MIANIYHMIVKKKYVKKDQEQKDPNYLEAFKLAQEKLINMCKPISKDEDSILHEDPGTIYENRIKFIRQDNKFFIDKLPGNYQSIGFIKHIFPKSKIIYVRRDPWDNAISLYKQFYVYSNYYYHRYYS